MKAQGFVGKPLPWYPAVMADPARNKNIRQISPQGLILYQQLLSGIAFMKRQQWATTNYAALIYAGIVFLNEKFPVKFSWVLPTTAVVTGLVATGLLLKFQYDLYKLRKRIATANNYIYIGHERFALGIEDKDKNPFRRGGLILLALIAVCVGGAILVALLTWAPHKGP
jgi:hypothetical protein